MTLTIPTMTQAQREQILRKCDELISEITEILEDGDVNEDEFKHLCKGVASAAIVKAAITSWGEKQ